MPIPNWRGEDIYLGQNRCLKQQAVDIHWLKNSKKNFCLSKCEKNNNV